MNNGGFPNSDFYNEHEGAGGESFWPSFTDIMMVIVMVFLLVSVAVILNNWQLMEDLKRSVSAEQQAAQQAQAALSAAEMKTEENETLAQRLARMEALVTRRTTTVRQLQQQNKIVSSELVSSRQQAEQRLQALETLQAESASLKTTLSANESVLSQLKTTLVTKEEQTERLLKRSEADKQALDKAESKANNSQDELKALREKLQNGHEQLASLKGEYDSLDKKYQKLLKPARSEKSKYVVRVIYNKARGVATYQLKHAASKGSKKISRAVLDKQLMALKKKYGDRLYVKIIIPESSGLSHSEAWKFTKRLLNTYDYYYQDKK
jgi:DNA repair exonuclease SbcCD ATPase subunit